MQVIKPVRSKRKAAEGTAASTAAEGTAASTAAEGTAASTAASTAAEGTAAEGTAAPAAHPARGLLRKSAIRRWLKTEFDFPLQIREAFFAAAEAKFADDLRRSVARARELKRSTLMAPDA
jgi:hypothetical protein